MLEEKSDNFCQVTKKTTQNIVEVQSKKSGSFGVLTVFYTRLMHIFFPHEEKQNQHFMTLNIPLTKWLNLTHSNCLSCLLKF